MGFGITDGFCHSMRHRTTSGSVIRVLSGSVLLLDIPPSVLGIEEVCNPRMHHRVYLLHTTLYAVVMEISPRHTCGSRSACHTSPKFISYDAASNDTTQISILMYPVRFHVLNLRAIGKYDLIKLCG